MNNIVSFCNRKNKETFPQWANCIRHYLAILQGLVYLDEVEVKKIPYPRSKVQVFGYINGIQVLVMRYGRNLRSGLSLFGDTPLIRAIYFKAYGLAKALIENGANVNLRNHFDQSPIFYSVTFKRPKELVKLLIKNDADINKREYRSNNTLLHYSVLTNNHDVTFLLLENGVDIEVKNIAGKTALDLCKDNWLRLNTNTNIMNEAFIEWYINPNCVEVQMAKHNILWNFTQSLPYSLQIRNGLFEAFTESKHFDFLVLYRLRYYEGC